MTNYTLSPIVGAFSVASPSGASVLLESPDETTGLMYVGTGAFTVVVLSLPSSLAVVCADGVGAHDTMLSPGYIAGAEVDELVRVHPSDGEQAAYGQSLTDLAQIAPRHTLAYPVILSAGVGAHDVSTAALALTVMDRLFVAPRHVAAAAYGLLLAEALALDGGLFNFFSGVVSESVIMSTTALPLWQLGASVVSGVGLHDVLVNSFVVSMVLSEDIDIDDSQILQMIFAGDPLLDGVQLSAAYVSPDGNFTTWAINTRTNAVTEYQNWAFNSFAKIGHKYLGANSSGLYELDGSTDSGANIATTVQSGLMQLGGSRLVSFKCAYLGMMARDDASTDVFLRLETGDGQQFTYAVRPKYMETARVNMGKGLRARYFSWTLTTVSVDYDLHSIEFVPLVAQRRI